MHIDLINLRMATTPQLNKAFCDFHIDSMFTFNGIKVDDPTYSFKHL